MESLKIYYELLYAILSPFYHKGFVVVVVGRALAARGGAGHRTFIAHGLQRHGGPALLYP